MKTRLLLAALMILFLPAFVFAQAALLAYFQDVSGDFRIVSEDGSQELFSDDLSFGDEVPVGWTVVTGNADTAELQLEPNGTIIKIAENTNFKVEALAGRDGARSNDFALGFGRFRAIAARLTGSERYNVRGQASVCGVRGTDFGMTIEPGVEEAFVFDGEIEYTLLETQRTITLSAGQFAAAVGGAFEPTPIPSARASQLRELLDFESLNPTTVQQVPPAPQPEPIPEPEPDAGEGGLLDRLGAAFGIEIGALTIGDQTYSKAIIAPTIQVNKLRMALYLPIIYEENILDPGDWYEPQGNNPWSFGVDQDGDILETAHDFARDLALKFRYLQYGDQRDPFFIKLGNLDNFTVGHGLIMRNYANDADFPAIHRVGFNVGVDFETLGFEAIVNDLADIQIVGGRVYLRPTPEAFPLAIGVSGIVDLYPLRELGSEQAEVFGDPMLINVGTDVEYPLIRRDALSMVLFGDLAGMLPYYRNDGQGAFSGVSKGLGLDTLYVEGEGLRNYGAMAGVLGNLGPIDYRADFRYYQGSFVPAIFDNIYDKQRVSYAIQAATFSNDPDSDEFDQITMGLYGEAGYTWENTFSVEAGYLWPFEIDDGRWKPQQRDYLHAEAALEQGVIPVVNIGMSIAYDRYFLLPLLFDGETKDGTKLRAFDENTVIKTTVVYGVSPTVDLVFLATNTVARDESGDPIYRSSGRPKIATTLTIETQIHF